MKLKRLLLTAALAAATLPSVFAQALEPPKLVLLVAADQFRGDYLFRFRADYKSGLKRLLDEGAVFTNGYYDHAPTVTAIGHSVMLTGAMPSASGIVGNEWYDRASGKQVTNVSDPAVQTLGNPLREGASPHRLLVSTIGDELKMRGTTRTKVIGVSIKDRGAILPAGRMADGAFWYDTATGNFVSSTWYGQALPAWAQKFNDSRVIDQFAGKTWKPAWGGEPFLTLPAAGKALWSKIGSTSYGNDMVGLFAEAALEGENLGRNGGTDVLTVSFSSNDSIGHDKGPDSPEVRDVSIRTDVVLGRLLDLVDKRIGLKNVLVIFTADHGVAPLPELSQQRRMPGGRLSSNEVRATVDAALSAKFGQEKWVVGLSGPGPYLDHALIARKGLSLDEVQNVAAQAVRDMPHIARVYTRGELRRGLSSDDMATRRINNGFFYQRASDIAIIAEPYWMFSSSGTTHGTPWNYDAHVPMAFLGPWMKRGHYAQRVIVNDIAATVATIVGVPLPSGCSGRPLTEALTGRP